MREFCFKNINSKERPSFPCFKDLWDLAGWREVCATGREGCCKHTVHPDLGAAARCRPRPQPDSLHNPSKAGPKGQLAKLMWRMPFAPPDINLHGNASVRIVLCFTPLEKEGKKKKKKTNYKLEMCHTFLGSRLGIRIQFDKGFLALGWGKCFWVVKPSHSGSRSTFLNFQRGCLWVTGITHPLVYSVGSLTAISESRNRLLNDL